MKFKILLWVLSKLILRANKKNASLHKVISKKNIIFQFMTQDKKIVRHFQIKKGTIFSKPAINENSDFSIIFKDSDYAFSVLLSKDKEAFTNGILNGDIILEGDISLVIWFQNIVSRLKKEQKSVPEELSIIGFVGVGLIGAPMARTLIRNGFTVKAYDKNKEALDKIVSDGAIPCDSLDALKNVHAIIIMVNTMQQVEEVITKLTKILSEKASIPILIMSTVLPDSIKALRKKLDDMGRKDIEFIDAPVSGGPLWAEAGKLCIMAGGKKEIFDKLQPVLFSMGQAEKVFYMGNLGSGSAMKLINNIIQISMGLNIREALILGKKKGLMPDYMARVINESSGRNFYTEQWPLTKKMFEMVLTDKTYNAKSALFATGLKDLETAKEWGKMDNIEIPCVENAIAQVNNLSEDEFASSLEMLLK